MSLDITIAGVAIPTDVAALRDLKADLHLAFALEAKLSPFLDSALSLAPSFGKSIVTYTSPALSWTPVESLVTFGLQGGAACSLEIVTSGDLVSYMDGLQSPAAKTVTVPAGHAYVRLTLSFTLSANASAKYSGGAYGVTASGTSQSAYAVTFCKAFLPTTSLKSAIAATFESFVVPFTPRTLTDMSDGDYLLHEFDGNIGFAIGAYAGVDKVLYAGQGSADVIQAFGSPLATFSGAVKPEIKAAVSLDFKLTYASRFEALLSKVGTAGRLHLFKASTFSSVEKLSAGLQIDLNAAVTVKERVTEHLPELKTTLVKAAGGPGTLAGDAVGAVIDAAQSKLELQKYVDEATDKLTSWLNRANGLTSNLEVAIENTGSRTLLVGYTFDISSQAFPAAWKFAVDGDFFQALRTGAVEMDPGSGLEKEYQSKTSFQCNFFNLRHMSTWSQFQESVSMVYAGNNVFHMVAKVGRSIETDSVGAMRSMDIYFSATADTGQNGTVSNSEISLTIAMNASGNRQAIEGIATLLSSVDRSQTIATLVRDLRAFNTNTTKGTVQLLVNIPSSSFGNIQAEAKAGAHDQVNWNAFASAADDLNAWPLRNMSAVSTQMLHFLKQYGAWEELNKVETGASAPDRANVGTAGNWPQDWIGIDPSWRPTISRSMLAGQSFMNFCAALQELANLQAVDAVKPSWEGLLKIITGAIKDNVSVDFLRPTALATIRLCKGTTFALSGPAGPAIPTDHFGVSIVL